MEGAGSDLEGSFLIVGLGRKEIGQDIVVIGGTDQLADWKADLLGIVGAKILQRNSLLEP